MKKSSPAWFFLCNRERDLFLIEKQGGKRRWWNDESQTLQVTSCNNSFKVFRKRLNSLWCCQCPKCVFVFLILSPFLSKKEIISIFKKNLFQEESLIPMFQDLLGFGKIKPFDCVGTFEESRTALFLASKKFKNDLVVKTFLPKIKHSDKLTEKVFKTYFASTIPKQFQFFGIN